MAARYAKTERALGDNALTALVVIAVYRACPRLNAMAARAFGEIVLDSEEKFLAGIGAVTRP